MSHDSHYVHVLFKLCNVLSLSRLRLLLVSRVLVSPAPVLTGVGVAVGGAAGVAVEGLTVVIHLSLERQ